MNSSALLSRFLKYVRVDTQSDPDSETYPSTEKQKNLGSILVDELLEMGINDAAMDEYGYVYATLPSNSDKNVPVICFCSHMDTSPDASGTDVNPIVHSNYDGSDIVLPDDPKQIISPSAHPDLKEQTGNVIITASGTTLLGADNKSGLAAIMTATEYLLKNPEIKHGKVRILFTPDEEIGRGVDKVDLNKLGADFGYTIDGEKAGSLEDETFSADAATLTIYGVGTHPGFAKDKMENALKIAADILAALPKDRLSPETTEGKEGFIHPNIVRGNAEKAEIKFILRDFTEDALLAKSVTLREIAAGVLKSYPGSSFDLQIKEQYRNMKEILDQHPEVVANAEEAIKRVGLNPIRQSIRGGTDGSRLSHMGLPCPNIFAGEHAFHSKHEWVSLQDMVKSAQTIVALIQVWEERTK